MFIEIIDRDIQIIKNTQINTYVHLAGLFPSCTSISNSGQLVPDTGLPSKSYTEVAESMFDPA